MHCIREFELWSFSILDAYDDSSKSFRPIFAYEVVILDSTKHETTTMKVEDERTTICRSIRWLVDSGRDGLLISSWDSDVFSDNTGEIWICNARQLSNS